MADTFHSTPPRHLVSKTVLQSDEPSDKSRIHIVYVQMNLIFIYLNYLEVYTQVIVVR